MPPAANRDFSRGGTAVGAYEPLDGTANSADAEVAGSESTRRVTWREWLFGSRSADEDPLVLPEQSSEQSDWSVRGYGNRKYRELVDAQLDKFMPFMGEYLLSYGSLQATIRVRAQTELWPRCRCSCREN